jgi:hypothetical protein
VDPFGFNKGKFEYRALWNRIEEIYTALGGEEGGEEDEKEGEGEEEGECNSKMGADSGVAAAQVVGT